VRAPKEKNPGSGRNFVGSLERLLNLMEYPILSTQVRSLRILLYKKESMDNREWANNMDEELEASNEERQRLILKFNSLSYTTKFTLGTLSQHHFLIHQLHDEVDFLRCQLVSLQEQTTQNNEDPSNSKTFVGTTEGEEEEVGILPDLNTPMEFEEEQEEPEKSLESTKK
jgi:hypothetical protein